MEGRMKKYRQVSPERAKVWTEKSPKYHYNQNYNNNQQQQHHQHHNGKVAVVYYLCRNQQLEHPHFMEVPLSSSDGLYLRDVIERLNVLRGRGMASMYSWSCKRSYKNGYVWHDLSDDDLIHPAHGNEYVLKGSELFEESNSGRFSPAVPYILQNQKALPEPLSARSQEESSSSSSLNGRTPKSSHDDEISHPVQRSCSSALSPESSVGKNSSWNGSLSLAEYKVYKSDGLSDASTQTEEKGSRAVEPRDTCIRGVSTDDGSLEPGSSGTNENQVSQVIETPENCRGFVSPPPATSNASSSSCRTDTLESLIRDDVKKLNSFRILEEEGVRMPPNAKLKASNMIMQLISCGSVSVKDHSFGLIPTYKPRFSHSKFPSPLFSTSLMLGKLDCARENPCLMGGRLEYKEYFRGSLAETSMLKESAPVLQQSSSFNADSSTQQLDSIEDNEEGSSTSLKCIPRSIKASLSNKPKSESMRSPISEGHRISCERAESSRTIKSGTSNGGSKRMTEPLPGSSGNDMENVITIEERLASGARVIIQSKISSGSEGTS